MAELERIECNTKKILEEISGLGNPDVEHAISV